MTPGKYTIRIYQGATFVREITWTGKDLTGYTARLHMRPSHLSTGDPTFEMTTENGRITLGGANGKINLTISAADTALIPDQDFVYDLELEKDGVVVRLLEGKVKVYAEVTR